MSTPRTSATLIGTAPFFAVKVARPEPSTTVSARFTACVFVDVVDAGREEQVLALGQRRVDRPTESDGLATKKSLSGSDRPAV